MAIYDLKARTKGFAISAAKLVSKLPANRINNVYIGQLIRSASSVGANYRAANRARSTPDFINKLKIVEEELDESMFFLEMLKEFNLGYGDEIQENWNEGNELTAIVVTSVKTARSRQD